VDEGEVIPQGNTNLGVKLNSSSRLSSDDWSNVSLNQVNNAVWNAACLSIQQDALLAAWFTDHKQFTPSIRLQV
jgi:hypothetical protein